MDSNHPDKGGREMPVPANTDADDSQDKEPSKTKATVHLTVTKGAEAKKTDGGGGKPTEEEDTEDGNEDKSVCEVDATKADPPQSTEHMGDEAETVQQKEDAAEEGMSDTGKDEVKATDGGADDPTKRVTGGGDGEMLGDGTSAADMLQTTEASGTVNRERSAQTEEEACPVSAGDVGAPADFRAVKPTSQEDFGATPQLAVTEAKKTDGGGDKPTEEDTEDGDEDKTVPEVDGTEHMPDGQDDQQKIQHPVETTPTKTEEERIGPVSSPPTQSTLPLSVGMIIGAVLITVVAVLVVIWLRPTAEPKRPHLNRVEMLKEEMAKVEQSFRGQRTELWRRSRIHLQRHVKSAQPSEPVSLILVGGRRAERTLGCLAARLAEAFSLVFNGSVLQVDGTRLANVDHDQVKLELDNQLKEAFEGDKPAAVIHRLEELPPSSTLIFYRYCDHENAAYKHPLLAFTVLLPQDAVESEVSISQVEEMVHSHIHQKFLTSDQPDTFDRMDVDKLSGLWSRISHLILPVNMEKHVEQGGCIRN